jgi:hypothetical protein
MSFIRRKWTPAEASNWTKEDYLAMMFSVMSYIGLGIGIPMAFFGIVGWIMVIVGVASALIMVWIIDPKIKAESEDFATKQEGYLEDLRKNQQWED